MSSRHLFLFLVTAILTDTSAYAVEPALAALLPVNPEIRTILDRNCVMCHGESIDGRKETREDIDLSTDDALRTTLPEIGKLKQMILEDKMPQKPKLSRRLRGNAELQTRLDALKADYDKNGDKEVLLAWLKDVTATTGDKED